MAKPRISTGSKIAERLDAAMKAHPHCSTQTALAVKSGIAQSTIGRILRGDSIPGAQTLQTLASVLGVSVEHLIGDDDPTAGSARPILTWDHHDDLPPGEFALIRRLAVKLSAGNGHERVDWSQDETLKPQAFRADWIRKMRLHPDRLACLTADGDSMLERIQDGDALVVDLSQTLVLDGKVYALWYDGGERVKRLYRLPGGGLRIASDNPHYQTIDVPAADLEYIYIIGRVVHVAGEGGL